VQRAGFGGIPAAGRLQQLDQFQTAVAVGVEQPGRPRETVALIAAVCAEVLVPGLGGVAHADLSLDFLQVAQEENHRRVLVGQAENVQSFHESVAVELVDPVDVGAGALRIQGKLRDELRAAVHVEVPQQERALGAERFTR